MRAGRGGRREKLQGARESRPKTGEMEVESESFTPPGVALATSGAGIGGGGGGGGGGRTGGEEEPPGSHSHVTTELNI